MIQNTDLTAKSLSYTEIYWDIHKQNTVKLFYSTNS